MKTIAKTFAITSLAVALVGTTVNLTTTPAEAGPKFSSGSKSLSGTDLGSGR